MTRQVMIATLGSEPQVVTLALDLLRAREYHIEQVEVIHTTGRVIQPALRRLRRAFSSGDLPAYRTVAIRGKEGTVDDIATEADAAAVLQTMYQAVLLAKRRGWLVHLSVAGGRKPMAVYGMVVAQLLFDADDRLWHLLSEGWRPGHERVMRKRPDDGVTLVPIPVLRWSNVSPVLTELALQDDPWDAIQAQRSMRRQEDRRRKREFLDRWLTPAEREVVRFASRGLDNATIAERLDKAEKTVANQLTSVYAKLHEWRGYRTDVPVTRAVLVAEFALYFSSERR
jgi:CRISPR-associated protein Csx14